jgi:hypothetical protein
MGLQRLGLGYISSGTTMAFSPTYHHAGEEKE